MDGRSKEGGYWLGGYSFCVATTEGNMDLLGGFSSCEDIEYSCSLGGYSFCGATAAGGGTD